MGHNGNRTENILWRLQNGELEFKKSPKLFMILLGTHNADKQHFGRMHSAQEIQPVTPRPLALPVAALIDRMLPGSLKSGPTSTHYSGRGR